FAEDPDDVNTARCDPCSQIEHNPVVLQRASISSHIKSAKHQKSVARFKELATQRNSCTRAGPAELNSPPPATLNVGSTNPSAPSLDYMDIESWTFSAGEEEDPARRMQRLRDELNQLYIEEGRLAEGDINYDDNTECDDCTNPWRYGFAEPAQHESNSGIDIESIESLEERLFNAQTDHDWSPYPSKTMFLLDLLDNMPRLRLSDAHMRLIIWVMKQAGCPNMPSFTELRKAQEGLRKTIGLKTHQYTSQIGNIFYMNDIPKLIAQDISNPLTAGHIRWYPEENSDGKVSEAWHAERWAKELPNDKLSPMYAQGLKHYYVNELSQTATGHYVIPLRWIMRDGELTADAYDVQISSAGNFSVDDSRLVQITASNLERNFLDLQPVQSDFEEGSKMHFERMPNPLRAIAQGDELYVSHIQIWGDDVSGNRSKQYNLHNNLYFSHANLPHRMLQQEYFVRFASTSPHASVVEQMAAAVQQINENNKDPVRSFNPISCTYCRVIIEIECLPGDNPQQSEETSHIGLMGRLFCRRCQVGGSAAEVEATTGYDSLYSPGTPRTAEKTRADIAEQLRLACRGVEARIEEHQTATGTKDKILQHWIPTILTKSKDVYAVCRKEFGNQALSAELREKLLAETEETVLDWAKGLSQPLFNSLFTVEGLQTEHSFSCNGRGTSSSARSAPLLGLSPNRDSPVESLHTISLGSNKYAWTLLHQPWGKTFGPKHRLLAARLQSTDTNGLTIPPIRANYILQYRNGLIGKHFKSLQQTVIFHLYGELENRPVFQIYKAAGFLGAVLWYHVIDDMDAYIADLEVLIGNLLDAFADQDPARITVKAKLHILTHIPGDIRRLGPQIRNHQAPSRDIALKMADLERFKQLVSGTYWVHNTSQEPVQASRPIRRVLHETAVIQRQLGWAPKPTALPKPGEIVLPLRKKRISREALPATAHFQLGLSNRAPGRYGSGQEEVRFGRIAEILVAENPVIGTPNSVLIVDAFHVMNTLHAELDMPLLLRVKTGDTAIQHVISPPTVSFLFNAQHDCFTLGCSLENTRLIFQEREELSDRFGPALKHTEDSQFIVNLHALHNADILRKTLPRRFTQPRPLHADRKEFHASQAAKLQVSGPAKRAATQEKAAATRAANKAKAAAAQEGA
ncbi:hypothetical protein FRC01_004436, partial [Tulasnella sp. 417]